MGAVRKDQNTIEKLAIGRNRGEFFNITRGKKGMTDTDVGVHLWVCSYVLAFLR